MAHDITFQILNEKNDIIDKHNHVICFSVLNYKYDDFPAKGKIKFLIDKKNDLEVVNWYVEGLNEMGLPCKFKNGEKFYNFYVDKQPKFNQILAILTAIRYLHENDYYKMINWGYNLSKQPENKYDFFTIFQLMHFSFSCTMEIGHSFITPDNAIYQPLYKLGDKSNFLSNLKSDTLVNNLLIDKSKGKVKEDEIRKFSGLMKNGEIGKLLEILK